MLSNLRLGQILILSAFDGKTVKYMDAKRHVKFQEYVELLEESKGDTLWNADYIDYKKYIDYSIGTIDDHEEVTKHKKRLYDKPDGYFDKVQKIIMDRHGFTDTSEYFSYVSPYNKAGEKEYLKEMDKLGWADIDLGLAPNNANAIKSYLKKLKNAKPTDAPRKESIKFLISVYEPLEKVGDLVKEMKGKTTKGRKPNPDAKPKNLFKKPPTAKARVLLLAKLKKITAKAEKDLLKDFEAKYLATAKHVVDLIKKEKITDISNYNRKKNTNLDIKYIDIGGSSYTIDFKKVKLSKNHKALIKKDAKDHVDSIVKTFGAKIMDKVGSLIGQVKLADALEIGVGDMSSHAGTFEAELWCEWGDDVASFYVTTSVVYGESARGKQFVRYPLRFHDIYDTNEKKLSGPSEEKMWKVWLKQVNGE